MPRETRFGVFEMGMNHKGELADLTRLSARTSPSSPRSPRRTANFFASEADIADAKAEIFQGLEPGGTAIIPFDSPHCARLAAAAKARSARFLTFGLGEGAHVHTSYVVRGPRGGSMVTAQLPARR
jgi:UDP-N-acetylmuramoyl-tripeptide--D-alanyl-D-alanine ligase